MNLATLQSLLEHYGLDEASRQDLKDWHPPDSLAHALHQAALIALETKLPQPLDARRKASLDRFCALFGQAPLWDFSVPYLNALSQRWVDLTEEAIEAEWICVVLARSQSALSSAPPALTRAVMLIAAALLRASRQQAETRRQLAAANDEATGLYRTEQAVAQIQTWITEGKPGVFATAVLRVAIGPLLLRLSGSLQRALLRQITSRLRRTLRAQDALFSGGEWEWILLLPGLEDDSTLQGHLSRLIHVFDVPFDVFGREYRLSVHVGASFYPAGGSEADPLFRSARIALFEATRSGAHFAVFRAEMDHTAARYAAIEHGFLEALREDKLELYLQPQIDSATGACSKAEALLRWSHAGGYTVAPQFIVEIALEAGMQHHFSHWLVTRAVRTLAELDRRGLCIGVSINLTAHDLADPELIGLIRQALALWRVAASRLTIELTEAAIIPDDQHSLEALHALRGLGCRLAVDDFGTGYSSMAYLRQMPLNELKIDQLFVRRMTQSEQDREIVRSMLQLAHGLHLEVVAEGVEDQATADLLRDLGCQRMQGFLFSQAMPLPQFISWFQAREAKA
jgi:predicted signal transduction protein with EAL and GGDEF domain